MRTQEFFAYWHLHPDVYYAQEFSGHGVALTNIVGRILAETIA